MIENPILRGFCPDPSIIRVGEDYFIAVSTFEWWPGVRLYHSKDLKHWEQIPSPLQRISQLDLTGDPTSGGVWAPCLSYDGTYYYLLYTDVKTKKGRFYNTHNYVVYTNDIYGRWSEPVYLNSIGFDPSLFHDTDGKMYLINMVNGFKGILVQELAKGSFCPLCDRKKVYDGSGIGCTEGPHMYHIGDWYYLLTAEGGTGYDHCISLARSRSIWGPFETAPDNPILTSDQSNPLALQKSGHGDLVETIYGEWYLVHLCSRPLQGEKLCTLGRETAIQKMILKEDGWFHLQAGGKYAQNETEEPVNHPEYIGNEEKDGFYDDFENSSLSVRYSSPRHSYYEFSDCKIREGYVRIQGQESLNSLHKVSLLAVRQQHISFRAETVMEFVPQYSEQMAGIVYYYDAYNFYVLARTCSEEGEQIIILLQSDGGIISDQTAPIVIPTQKETGLRIDVSKDGTKAAFYYSIDGASWLQAGVSQSTDILTDEHCRGFTGAHIGLYVHDMADQRAYADFDYLRYEPF